MPKATKHAARSVNGSSDRKQPPLLPKTAVELTQDALELVRQMLMYLDPQAAYQLPIDLPAGTGAPVPIPISEWNVLYTTPTPAGPHDPLKSSIRVLSYPAPGKNLYCVRSVVPDITARQFWALMAESGNRHMWDSTVQEGGNFRWCEQELKSNAAADSPDRQLARSIAARLEYLKFGSIFMVAKPRDMVLLSADVQLPPSSESPLRLVSSCRSEADPGKPPLKGYTRFDLGVGGFMVEEFGDDGLGGPSSSKHNGRKAIRVTQLSDLGEMASWVPSSVVRMVAQSLVPRSLALIAKAAATIKAPHPLSLAHVSEEVNLHDEDVVKGGERWSRGRGLPGLVGVGVLGKPSASPQNGHIRQPSQPSLVSGQSDVVSVESLGEASQEAPAGVPATPDVPQAISAAGDEEVAEMTDQVSLLRKPSHSPTRSRRPPISRNASTEEPPLLSLTLQRLSTQLHEDSPPPLSPSQQQRLALQGYFHGGRDGSGHRSPGSSSMTPSSSRDDYFLGRSIRSGSNASPWGTGSETGSYMTFGLPSGERTVPGSLNDVEEGSRFPFDAAGSEEGASLNQGAVSSGRGSMGRLSAARASDDDAGDETIVVDDQRKEAERHSISESEAETPASKDTTPSSRSSRQEDLRFKDAAELDKRLLRISKALQSTDQPGPSGSRMGLIADPKRIDVDRIGEAREASPASRASAFRQAYLPTKRNEGEDGGEDDDDDQDEVDDLLAEALSVSLSAPKLRGRFSPRSPPSDLHGLRGSRRSRRHFSPPSSPASKAARREASELSAILLAGSDALVSVLAPGARQTLAGIPGSVGAIDDLGDTHMLPAQVEQAAPSSPHAFRHFFTGTSATLDNSGDTQATVTLASARPSYSKTSSSFSSATTQISSAYALRQSSASVSDRGTSTYSSNTEYSEQDGRGTPTSSRSQRSWKRSLAGAPYALALGMMAMVWARGSQGKKRESRIRKSWRGSRETEESYVGRPSSSAASTAPPSAYQGAARRALLRTMSSNDTRNAVASKRGAMNRSVSSPQQTHHHGSNGSNIVIPPESSDLRRLSRENYMGNTKLLTTGRRGGLAGVDARMNAVEGV